MIILETNVNGILALPPKCNTPIASDRNGVLSTPVAFERVKPKARKIYISRPRRRVDGVQDHADRLSGKQRQTLMDEAPLSSSCSAGISGTNKRPGVSIPGPNAKPILVWLAHVLSYRGAIYKVARGLSTLQGWFEVGALVLLVEHYRAGRIAHADPCTRA